ncbi:MAG TPA: TraR/DksA family transcriptional regulator [Sphingomicrobium sp.]|nr:TraR/DksA family transcriptional regulator [Sphingomicrobium sp.]
MIISISFYLKNIARTGPFRMAIVRRDRRKPVRARLPQWLGREASHPKAWVARWVLASDTAGMTIDRNRLREKLQSLKAELANSDAGAAAERATVELDQQSVGRLSRMDAIQVQAMAIAAEQRRKAELARVESALERLDTDEFGYCEICGEEIASARIERNPAVTTCISCAK